MFESINPVTETVFERVGLDDAETIDTRLEAARRSFARWRSLTFAERADFIRAFARCLRDDREELGFLMTREMGKPIAESRGEVDKAAWCFEHYADHAADYLADIDLESDARHSYVQHLPLGTVFGILPWNSPLWLASRCAAPALMAGNTVIIKPDSHLPGCTGALASRARQTLPEGVLQFIHVDNDGAERVLRDSRVQAVSFTGSSKAGKIVGAIAGSEAKPAVLELGGSDPAIVLADADLDAAAETIKTSRMINAGQSCIAAKRILVEETVYDDFIGKMKGFLEALRMGDPEDPDTDIGPLARANHTAYGLAASIWTERQRGEALAAQLEAGQVAVNGLVKTDPRLPSGGIKSSGLGRELGPHGIREFVNVQQVWVGPAR